MSGIAQKLMLISVLCLACNSSSAIAREALPEYTIKAGYLYNFALLTEWPAHSLGETIQMCLFGKQDFEEALEVVRGKKVDNRHITIRYLETPEEVKSCNILYVAEIERWKMHRVMHVIGSQPVLIVTDDESLAEVGAMIFLHPLEQRLAFKIDSDLAKSANLRISARLLRLSR